MVRSPICIDLTHHDGPWKSTHTLTVETAGVPTNDTCTYDIAVNRRMGLINAPDTLIKPYLCINLTEQN